MSAFHIIVMIVVGLIAGALARLLMPGRDPMGILMTIVLGIVGSFIGGFISNLIFHYGNTTSFHPAGIIMSVIGAMLVLWVWRMVRART